MSQRRTTLEHVAAAVSSAGLRPGVSRATVAETLWSPASPMYALFVQQAGRSPDHFEAWLTLNLTAALAEPLPSP